MVQQKQNLQQIYQEYLLHGKQQAVQEGQAPVQAGQEEIVAVQKNEDGNLIAFKTNTGRVLDYVSALAEAKAGKLAHVDVFHKYGRDILRSELDGIEENNLDHLPEF
ncbi:DUF3892 domain-containing protein [Ammoniphilus sp. CFH 90114]|uniref:DUF3892 domain-containing protein n=1 Tax=Ammoniphilus sp. CFH 90114 TaxID=2493665 RepID=UPI00100E5127|nr:DUF3892 domain-containing protein [Ammoniphilus sp. CFH 90114]RXT03822.1 DUF3892 domain-containing protein [Ammoniphilus sp. CFH 90114]